VQSLGEGLPAQPFGKNGIHVATHLGSVHLFRTGIDRRKYDGEAFRFCFSFSCLNDLQTELC
jgi:hypothetical protein